MNSPSRGGAKPRMLTTAGSRDLPINANGQSKRGLYQISHDDRILARLVELPSWLSSLAFSSRSAGKPFLDELLTGTIRTPSTAKDESRGHILIDARKFTSFSLPAVGIDKEFYDKFLDSNLQQIHFFVYGIDYHLCEKWSIKWDDFKIHSEPVESSSTFMTQYMVCVDKLKRIG